jgi:hypothetical protein
MPRRRITPVQPPTATPTVLSQPHVVCPTTIYSAPQLRAALGLRSSTLRREIRLGNLRVSKRAGRYFFLGAWVLQWLEAGELKIRRPTAGDGDNGAP